MIQVCLGRHADGGVDGRDVLLRGNQEVGVSYNSLVVDLIVVDENAARCLYMGGGIAWGSQSRTDLVGANLIVVNELREFFGGVQEFDQPGVVIHDGLMTRKTTE